MSSVVSGMGHQKQLPLTAIRDVKGGERSVPMEDGGDLMIFDLEPDPEPDPEPVVDMLDHERDSLDSPRFLPKKDVPVSWQKGERADPLLHTALQRASKRDTLSALVNSSGPDSMTFRTVSSKPYSYQTAPSYPDQTRPYPKPERSTLRRLFERNGVLPARNQPVILEPKNYASSAGGSPADQENGANQSNTVWSGFNDENDWSGYGMHVDLKKGDSLQLEPLDEIVGHGATATVDLVRCRGIKLARKTVLLRRTITMRDVLQEVYALHKLRHAHVIRLVGTYAQGKSFRMLLYPVADLTLSELLVSIHMENVGNSRSRSNNFQPVQGPWKRKLSDLSLCLVSALRYIHEQGIKHMDVKPQNILIKCSSALPSPQHLEMFLCDFGVSHIFESQSLNASQTDSFFGRTPRYAAPEVASDDRHGRAADVFSMGCVLAEINSVFCDFSLSEFDAFRQGAMLISSSISQEIVSSVPYHQTIGKAQQWARQLGNMAVNTETIASMLEQDPLRRPTLCNDVEDVIVQKEILKASGPSSAQVATHLSTAKRPVITLRCPHDADGPETYKYDIHSAYCTETPVDTRG